MRIVVGEETKPCALPGCHNLCIRTIWDDNVRWKNKKYCSRRCGALSRCYNKKHSNHTKHVINFNWIFRLTNRIKR